MHKVVQLCKHKHASHLACICRSFRLRTRWGWRRYLTNGLARSKVSQCTYLRSLNQVWIVHRRSASGGCSTGRKKALSLGTQQTPRKVDASFFQPWLLGTMRQCSLLTKCCWFMLCIWIYHLVFTRVRAGAGGKGAGEMGIRYLLVSCPPRARLPARGWGLGTRLDTCISQHVQWRSSPFLLTVFSTMQSCEKVPSNGEVHVHQNVSFHPRWDTKHNDGLNSQAFCCRFCLAVFSTGFELGLSVLHILALVPGPAQLSIACSTLSCFTILEAMELSWAGPTWLTYPYLRQHRPSFATLSE